MLHVACVLALHLRCALSGAARQCPWSPRLDAWMPAAASSVASAACLGLGPQLCLSFFLAIYLHTSLWETPRLASFLASCLAMPHLVPRCESRAAARLIVWPRCGAVRSCTYRGRREGRGRGNTRMLPANFTFSQISRGSF